MIANEHGGNFGSGLRARDVRQLQAELGRLEDRQQYEDAQRTAAKQQRRLSQNSHTSTHTARSRLLQPGDRQLSTGSGVPGRSFSHQHQRDETPSSSSIRKRRSPGSNASRTSTVLSAGARRSTRRGGDRYLEAPLASSSAAATSQEYSPSRIHGTVQHDSPLRRWCRLVEKTTRPSAASYAASAGARSWHDAYPEWAIAIAVIVWIKWAVGLGGWSGKGHPPLYGDLEAQRHWLSITNHLPMSKWYFHDLQYWGLDYPPLTAYHSWLLGKLAIAFGDARWVELKGRLGGTEQVYREEKAILFMRSTVILGDLLVYALPVAAWCAIKLGRWTSSDSSSSSASRRSTRTLVELPLLAVPEVG